MKTESYRWYSHRLGREMGLCVLRPLGLPVLAFPTSGGDEWELENRACSPRSRPTSTRAHQVLHGRVEQRRELLQHRRAPVPSQLDAAACSTSTSAGRSSRSSTSTPAACRRSRRWARRSARIHAANTLFKHPDAVKRCWAMSGVYDMRRFMDGFSDDNFYFNNPIDYIGGMHDSGRIGLLNTCDIHIATGTRSLGKARALLRLLTSARRQGHPPSPRRLGPARRPRLAVLEAPDVELPLGCVNRRRTQSAVHTSAIRNSEFGIRSWFRIRSSEFGTTAECTGAEWGINKEFAVGLLDFFSPRLRFQNHPCAACRNCHLRISPGDLDRAAGCVVGNARTVPFSR